MATWARVPLRGRLIVALLALVAAGLIVIVTVSVSMMRGDLSRRADDELATLLHQNFSRAVDAGEGDGGGLRLPSEFVLQLRDSGGRLTREYRSPLREEESGPAIPDDAGWLAALDNRLATVPATSGGVRWRVTADVLPGRGEIVVAGIDLAEVDRITSELASIELGVGGVVMLLLAVVGVAVVRASLRPLAEIERTASEVAGGDLSPRVPDRDPRTELGRLGRTFNTMLEQIERAIEERAGSEAKARGSEERMRRFAADASHELRTPVSIIRAWAQFHRKHPDQGDVDDVLGRIEDEAGRMGLLVEDLLLLARLDQRRPLELRPVDLLSVASTAVHHARLLAPDRDIGLVVADEAAFLVSGDEPRLHQVVGNLVSNALTHTPAGTPVGVRIRSEGPDVILEVADHGPGLTEDQAQRVFERFYRTDSSRTRRTGGTGLGLAIVAALVAAHDGAVEVVTAPDAGATFRIRLPLAGEAAAYLSDLTEISP